MRFWKIIGGLAVIAGASGYSAAWWVVGTKTKAWVEANLPQLEQANIQFSYEKMQLRGFPFAIAIVVDKPVILLPIGPEKQRYASDRLVLKTNVLCLSHQLRFEGNIYEEEEDDQEEKYVAQYADTPPTLTASYTKPVFMWKPNEEGMLATFGSYLKELSYEDRGYTNHQVGEDTPIHQTESANMKVKLRETKEGTEMRYVFSVKGIDHDTWRKKQGVEPIGKADVDMDIQLHINLERKEKESVYKGASAQIHQALFHTDKMGVAVKGALQMSNEELFPTGTVDIQLDNYKAVLAYLTSAETLSSRQAKAVEAVIKEAATPIKDKENSVTATVARDANTSVKIGTQTLEEVMQTYHQVMEAEEEKEKASAPLSQ